ncbi:hypothetical protein [Pseudomonas syringae]|uniref:hypothetical protein n=1 Tax=Pseudomonas syringae TaxID=317 RepID=UPI00187D0E28|nr:hypothetical protein [Pseudomonas syringae]
MQMWRTPELYFAQMSIPELLDFRSPPAKNLYLSGLLSLPVSEFGICLTKTPNAIVTAIPAFMAALGANRENGKNRTLVYRLKINFSHACVLIATRARWILFKELKSEDN